MGRVSAHTHHIASLRNDDKSSSLGVKHCASIILITTYRLGKIAKKKVTAIKRKIALLPLSKADQKIFVALRYFLGQLALPLHLAAARFPAPRLRLIEV